MHNFSVVYNFVITPRFVAQTLFGVNYFKQVFDDDNHGFNPPSIGMETGVTDPSNFGSPNINIAGFDSNRPDAALGPHRHHRPHRSDLHLHGGLAPDPFRRRLPLFASRRVLRRQRARQRSRSMARRGHLPPPARRTPGRWAEDVRPPRQVPPTRTSIRWRISLPAMSVSATPASPTAHSSEFTISRGLPIFGQDSWKITPKLTLNLGLNWVYQSPISNPKNLISTFIPADGGITYVGTHGLNTLWPRDLHDFAPRFGFAYQPKAGGKLVIRGGWGMYYQIAQHLLLRQQFRIQRRCVGH
jgi:hypothetical protein